MWNVEQFFVWWIAPDNVGHVASQCLILLPMANSWDKQKMHPISSQRALWRVVLLPLRSAAIKFSNIASDSPTDVGHSRWELEGIKKEAECSFMEQLFPTHSHVCVTFRVSGYMQAMPRHSGKTRKIGAMMLQVIITTIFIKCLLFICQFAWELCLIQSSERPVRLGLLLPVSWMPTVLAKVPQLTPGRTGLHGMQSHFKTCARNTCITLQLLKDWAEVKKTVQWLCYA